MTRLYLSLYRTSLRGSCSVDIIQKLQVYF